MRNGRRIALTLLLALPASGWAMAKGNGKGRPEPITCPADVPAAFADRCPCDGQKNHGHYVRCVAQFRNALRKAGCLDTQTRRTLARCAARSTCGKPNAVLCCFIDTGTCSDPAPGNLIAEGTCSNDPALPCDTDTGCTETRARVAPDEDACVADGGSSGGLGSVCGACTTTTTSTTTTTTVP